MVRRKVIFSILLVALGIAAIGRLSMRSNERLKTGNPIQANKRLEEIRPKEEKIKLDLDGLRKSSSVSTLLKRNPFFRVKIVYPQVAPGGMERKEEILIPVTEIEKVEPFSYKGKGKVKERQVLFIEDNATGKVYFVTKDDMVGDYKVLDITEEEVILCKEDQEIRLPTKPNQGPPKGSFAR